MRLSLRAAFCLCTPLVVGLIVDQRLYAIVAGIGALWGVSQDGLDSWRVRGPRLLWVAVAGGAGVGLGSLYVDHVASSTSLVLFVAVVAVIAGFIEASNHATAGAYLLIGTVLGVGLEFSGVELQCTLALVGGALWVYLISALMNRVFHLENQRVVLASAFNALATNVDAVGTASFHAGRAGALAAVDHAQDVVGSIDVHSPNDEEESLYRCLIVALRSGEAISYAEGKNIVTSPSVAPALREVARTLLDDGARAAVTLLPALRESFLSSSDLPAVAAYALRVDLTALPPQVTRFSRSPLLPVHERLRFAAIVACAVTTAMIISRVLNGPHGFWLPLAVAFILRPDVGPVIKRALARTVGTAVGVGIAALVALSGNTEVELIVLSCVMASIQPWAQRRSHALAVMTFTPIVFVFLGLIGERGDLFGVRILDTALGAVIVLLVDVLLWTTAPSMRPERLLADARAASARYADSPSDDPIRRNQLRRGALRAVARARVSIANARSEPRLLGRYDPSTLAQLDAIERSIDLATVSLLERDGTPPEERALGSVLVTTELDPTTLRLAERTGSSAARCRVVGTKRLSTSVSAITLAGPATTLAGVPGNDVMIRLADANGRLVSRRYSVRSLDPARDELTLWITTDHVGPGSQWVQDAQPGDEIDVIGPRGKIPLDPTADWHLFVGDVSALSAAYRMAESIEVPGRAIFIIEIDAPDDALPATFDEGLGVTGIFVERRGRALNDPSGLFGGLAAFELPSERGHAYLFGEFHVMRAMLSAVLDRGLAPEQISHKPYWRYGLSNAEHGEPDKS